LIAPCAEHELAKRGAIPNDLEIWDSGVEVRWDVTHRWLGLSCLGRLRQIQL
jgi:hypothetical protein